MTGRFQPGQSGNPAGRPRGTPNPSARLRQAIAGHVPAIVDRLVQAALAGDVGAAGLLLSRVLPPLRPESTAQVIADAGTTAVEQTNAIVQATLAGEISASAAGDLMNVLVGQCRVRDFAELERRLSALEARP